MNPIRIAPQKAYEEAQKFQQKIAAGMQVLRTLDDVHYGATEKEEVYREDKLVLYRFKGPHKPTAKVPILISYALANRPCMAPPSSGRCPTAGHRRVARRLTGRTPFRHIPARTARLAP